ncbi:MAG: chemotaxis protein MotB, partial [Flavobacteriales bacterium]
MMTMKQNNFPIKFLALAFVCALFASCASVKPCGEQYSSQAEFFQSKKFKEAKANMDSLCDRTADLETALEGTEEDLGDSQGREAKMIDDLARLQASYDRLKQSSGMEKAALGDELASKQEELQEKEAMLADREQRLKEMQEIIDRQDQLMNALSDKVKQALMGFDADELSVEMRDGKVYVSMSDKLLFKSASDA